MRSLERSSTLAACAATALVLLSTWLLGGQFTLGRIDPALAVPLLGFPALMLAWARRHDATASRRRTNALALTMILIAQAVLALLLSDRPPWLQLGLVAIAWTIVAVAADAVFRRATGRIVKCLCAAALVAGCFAGGHILLATLYRPGAAEGTPVTLLTGLPLRWSEGTDLAAMLAQGMDEDPALGRLRAAGPVEVVDSIVDHPPAPGGALLLAHPRALAPRELVAIDAYVRGGGRTVILADALTGWPMRHPIGDPRNPPVTTLLTPLLDHWGITLAAATGPDEGAAVFDIDGARLRLFSAGRFSVLPAACRPFAGGRIARCRFGAGEAWLVGDADLLFAPLWQPQPAWAVHLRRADSMEWLATRIWGDASSAALQPLWIRAAE